MAKSYGVVFTHRNAYEELEINAAGSSCGIFLMKRSLHPAKKRFGSEAEIF
jgi:hypothetical protein